MWTNWLSMSTLLTKEIPTLPNNELPALEWTKCLKVFFEKYMKQKESYVCDIHSHIFWKMLRKAILCIIACKNCSFSR